RAAIKAPSVVGSGTGVAVVLAALVVPKLSFQACNAVGDNGGVVPPRCHTRKSLPSTRPSPLKSPAPGLNVGISPNFTTPSITSPVLSLYSKPKSLSDNAPAASETG